MPFDVATARTSPFATHELRATTCASTSDERETATTSARDLETGPSLDIFWIVLCRPREPCNHFSRRREEALSAFFEPCSLDVVYYPPRIVEFRDVPLTPSQRLRPVYSPLFRPH